MHQVSALYPLQVLGDVKLEFLFNDGSKGTGNSKDMAIAERHTLATEGIVIAAVDVGRVRVKAGGGIEAAEGLECRIRVTTRGMWTNSGALLKQLHKDADKECRHMPTTSR